MRWAARWYFALVRCSLEGQTPCRGGELSINTKKFLVREDSRVDLKKWPTRVDPVYEGDDDYKKLLKDHVDKLSAQQELLYASNSYAVLLVFQAMDAAGKDGVIAHVMSGI